MEQYKPRHSAVIVSVLATLTLILGLIALITGIVAMFDRGIVLIPGVISIAGVYFIISGIVCIIYASFLYIIVYLSEDVHRLTYDVQQLARENATYQQFMLEHLQEVDRDHDAIKKGLAAISGKLDKSGRT